MTSNNRLYLTWEQIEKLKNSLTRGGMTLIFFWMIIFRKTVTEKKIRKTYFPKKTENRVSYVRPHARNAEDTYELPIVDKLTRLTEYTKHCFWLNVSYVKDGIYLK